MGGGKYLIKRSRGTDPKFVYYYIKTLVMEDPREEYEGDQLTEFEKMELERHMLYTAYENSYRVLTAKIEFNELVLQNDIQGTSALMAYDPTEGIRKEELQGIIDYYVGLDESHYYLRCAELKKILDEVDD